MLQKVFTMNCPKCDLMKVRDDGKSICSWGKSKKSKELITPKGKKVIKCKLSK